MSHHVLDAKIFRNPKDILSDEDKIYIKQWVKDNFIPNSLVDTFSHPYVKTEWKKQQERYELFLKMEKLDRESRNS